MKSAKLESKKTLKAAKSRRVSGVQVRSSVKAGRMQGGGGGPHEVGGPGGIGDSNLL